MGREEHGRTWCMDAAQLDTQRKKEEAILKTSSTIYSTNRSSSSTRPAKLQLDRAEKSKSNPKNKRSYNQKSGDCPDGSIERTAPKPRRPAGRETIVSCSAKVTSVRLKSRPKLQTDRPITQCDPGNIVPRSAKLQTLHATPRTTKAREPGNKASRPRNPVPRATADASVRAGKERPTSGRETIGQISIRSTTPDFLDCES
ncbi:unnamed protein product [Microthlaspi erraticum]|uniref:Uncharacterized protein n=1 Tax=Microthlaspi erraticum TaxID=1685480 RepID=A0A6D2HIE8_9BRAS|nr:unnamed protein product [Microthlaspi erraticum]